MPYLVEDEIAQLGLVWVEELSLFEPADVVLVEVVGSKSFEVFEPGNANNGGDVGVAVAFTIEQDCRVKWGRSPKRS